MRWANSFWLTSPTNLPLYQTFKTSPCTAQRVLSFSIRVWNRHHLSDSKLIFSFPTHTSSPRLTGAPLQSILAWSCHQNTLLLFYDWQSRKAPPNSEFSVTFLLMTQEALKHAGNRKPLKWFFLLSCEIWFCIFFPASFLSLSYVVLTHCFC